MTATDTKALAVAPAKAESAASWRRYLIFGSGLGIAVSGGNLEAAIARSRSSRAQLVAATTLEDFRNRPAAEWGSRLLAFLAAAQESHLAANVVLPREETIVRTIALPGVSDKEIPAAIELQLETLHPYGDEEVAWAWTRARGEFVLVAIVRKASLMSWETLFAEAGIPVAAFLFSSSAIHAALRIWSAAPASLLLYNTTAQGRTEVYGESEARAVYSAEPGFPVERSLAIARAELRLEPGAAAVQLSEALPAPNPPAAVSYSPVAWAAALAGSAPLSVTLANFLPKERRASSTRRQYLMTVVLAGLLLLAVLTAFVIYPAIDRVQYAAALNDEVRRLEPRAKLAQELELRANAAKARIATLDEIRRRPQADLEVLAELTRILPPQVWTNSIEIFPDSVVIAGEADQAAPLLKLLDSSPLFQNSEFALSVTRTNQVEQFRIKTMRRNRAGRTTP